MKRKDTVKRLLTLLGKHKILLLVSLLFSAGSTALNLIVPILTGDAIDCIVGEGQVDFKSLYRILIWFVIVILIASICRWMASLSNNRVSYTVVHDLRTQVFSHLQNLPLSTLDQMSTGDTMSRLITDVDQFSDGLLTGISRLFRSGLSIIGTLVVMFTKSLSVAVAVIAVSPLSVMAASFLAKKTYRYFRALSDARGRVSSYSEEIMNGTAEIRCFGYEKQAEEQFEKRNQKLQRVGVKGLFLSSLTNPVTRFVNAVVFAAAGTAGGFAVIQGYMTVGDLSALLSYCIRYTKPFNEISGVVTELQNSFSCFERVLDLLDLPEQAEDEPDAVDLLNPKGKIDFEDVSFSYRPNQKLISHLSFSVKKGQRVAIVGPTGSGKTTLVNLLMRFYEPNSGCIKVDGIPLSKISQSSLRNSFGMVLQETWLMSGTIAENIAYARPKAPREDIIRAAKKAYAHRFIQRLPKQYDTVIGEEWNGLSEGQRQLLCVARVMLLDPSILVLDEATSSIDTLTEQKVQEAFRKIMKGRTSFVVAHRLSTILDADLILVMKNGDVIEQGTHAELMAKNGFYREMFESQYAK